MRRMLRSLWAVGIALLIAPTAPVAADEPQLPTREEIQELFVDQLNRYTFTESGFSGWLTWASWTRQAEVVFPQTRFERARQGSFVDPGMLPAAELTVVRRTAPDGAEFQVMQAVTGAPINYFPLFTGDPTSFTFRDPTNPPFESEASCRALRELLVCRVVRHPDGRITYDTVHPAATGPAPQPSLSELLGLFADQVGKRTLRPSHLTAWRQVARWQRIAQIIFTADQDERVVEPTVIDPIPKELSLYQRFDHHRLQTGIIEWADRTRLGGGELFNRFPIFRGDLTEWTFFDTGLAPPPNDNYQELCRHLSTQRGDTFLICRTTLQGLSAFYQTYVPMALDEQVGQSRSR